MLKQPVSSQWGGYDSPVAESFEINAQASFLSSSGPGNSGIDTMNPWNGWENDDE